MKKIINLIVVIILLISTTRMYAQTAPPQSAASYETAPGVLEYRLLQNFPNPFKEVTLIQFDISSTCYAKMYVTDENNKEIEKLVEGEVDNGQYSVYFKPSSKLNEGIYICRLDIYTAEGSKLVHSLKTKMLYETAVR